MNLDKKLAGVLKRFAKPGAGGPSHSGATLAWRELQPKLHDSEVKDAVDKAASVLQTPPAEGAPFHEYLGIIRLLTEKNLPDSAEIVFLALIPIFKLLDLDAILQLAPTQKSFAGWIKATHAKKNQIQDKVTANAEGLWGTPAIEWVVEHGEPRSAARLLPLLLSKRTRPRHLPQWDEVLASAFKTPGGALLDAALKAQPTQPRNIETIAALFLSSPELLVNLTDTLPDLLDERDPDASVQLLKTVMEQVMAAPQDHRPRLSAAIARLGSNILLRCDELSPGHRQALETIAIVESRIRLEPTDDSIKARTWVLDKAISASDQLGDSQHLTLTGARLVAYAFEKARKGLNAVDILTVTAKNLGMTPIGAKGEKSPYNPIQHQDIHGGLTPGELVEITEPGWQFQSSTLLRAIVTRPGS